MRRRSTYPDGAAPQRRASRLLTRIVTLGWLGSVSCATPAPLCADVYQSPESFIAENLGLLPAPQTLWLNGDLQAKVKAVLGHPYKTLRVKFWRNNGKTIWILDEIGKEEDITIGFLVNGDAIERTSVLEFRESRGWEIKFPAFTRQFTGIRLGENDGLDRTIDGITGATLSVEAYRRLARLALLLHREAAAHAP